MEAPTAVGGGVAWRLWALVPIVLLALAVAVVVSQGDRVVDLLGGTPPPADEFDVRRVEFRAGEIRILVRNPQRDDLTIASVTVDDAIVPYMLDGPATLSRLRSSTIVVPYDWVADDPISVGITSSTGIETVEAVPAAFLTPEASSRGVLGYAAIGLLVGFVPIALGLLWLPALRRADPNWLAAFMALTAGLLTFLGVEAVSESLSRSNALPGSLGGAGVVLLGVAASWLGLTVISRRFSRRGRAEGAALSGMGLAMLVAVGIGLHNLGEGLAIGSSFALGELALGTFLIVGFMVHNVSEGLGIAAPIAEGGAAASRPRLLGLAAIAGLPTILGAWIGGYLTNDLLGVLFFAVAAGAALQVVTEVGRYVARRAPGGLGSPWVLGGFLAGIAVMYATGIIAG